ncbi:MAG: hypothetical protein AB8B85_09535 [Paracoccaceae bacterium]
MYEYEFDGGRDFDRDFLDQDTAVLEALERVDKGLFDAPEDKDDDLQALYEKAS